MVLNLETKIFHLLDEVLVFGNTMVTPEILLIEVTQITGRPGFRSLQKINIVFALLFYIKKTKLFC